MYHTQLLKDLIESKFAIKRAMDLVKAGADPNIKNSKKDPFLHLMDLGSIKELVEDFNADINIKDGKGNTLLQRLIETKFNLNDAMDLVRLGADPNIRDSKGEPFLHLMNKKSIKELVTKYNVDINTKDADGKTLLQRLLNTDFRTQDAFDLIQLGADVNTKDMKGNSFLHLFVIKSRDDDGKISHENLDAIAQLITLYWADTNIKNSQGKTALQLVKEEDLETIAILASLHQERMDNVETPNASAPPCEDDSYLNLYKREKEIDNKKDENKEFLAFFTQQKNTVDTQVKISNDLIELEQDSTTKQIRPSELSIFANSKNMTEEIKQEEQNTHLKENNLR